MAAPFITFGQLKTSRIVQIAGVTTGSEEFRQLVNDAGQALTLRGDWPGTLAHMYLCVRNGCVVWPRYVQSIRRMNKCNQEVKTSTIWYDFIDKDQYNAWLCGANFYSTKHIDQRGRVSTFNDIPIGNWQLKLFPAKPQDVGKTVTIFGLDNSGQPLTHRDAAGNWQDGLVITLKLPFVQTTVYIQSIDHVEKQVTQGQVRMYAVSPSDGNILDLAVYDLGETDPSYEKTHLNAGCNIGCGATAGSPFSVVALAKLAWVDVVADTDIVVISNKLAMKYAIQSLLLGDKGDFQGAVAAMDMAIAELNSLTDDIAPRDRTPVSSGFLGGGCVGMQQIL